MFFANIVGATAFIFYGEIIDKFLFECSKSEFIVGRGLAPAEKL